LTFSRQACSSADELADMSGITVPLHLSGPWAGATFTYELGQASGGNLAHLLKVNLARVAAGTADSNKTAGK